MSASKKNRKEPWMGGKARRETEEEKKNRQTRFWTILISAVLIVSCVALALWSSGVIPKNATAVTIGGQKCSAGVVQFYYKTAYKDFLDSYGSQAQMFGLDTSKPLDKQKYDDKTTWADYFLKSGLEKMEKTLVMVNEAKKANFSLTKGSADQIAKLKKNITAYCVNQNLSKSAYFSYYGSAVTEKLYYEQVENSYLVQDYINHMMDQMKYSDQELTDYYNGHKKDYDVVDYRFFLMDGSVPTTKDSSGKEVQPTDQQKNAAMSAASEKADKMVASLKKGEDFTALAKEYAPSDEKETYADPQKSIISGMNYASISSYPYANWLYETSRKSGDVTAVKAVGGYYVLQFLGRHRNDYNTVDMRQILVKAETSQTASKPTNQQKAAAKAKAESILEEWKKGKANEDAFAAMAKQYSEDADTKDNGGLCDKVYKTSTSTAISNWLFGKQHEAGDCAVIETDDGYSIVYFIKYNEAYWKLQVENDKKIAAYNSWYDKIKANYPISDKGFGMRFVI